MTVTHIIRGVILLYICLAKHQPARLFLPRVSLHSSEQKIPQLRKVEGKPPRMKSVLKTKTHGSTDECCPCCCCIKAVLCHRKRGFSSPGSDTYV